MFVCVCVFMAHLNVFCFVMILLSHARDLNRYYKAFIYVSPDF